MRLQAVILVVLLTHPACRPRETGIEEYAALGVSRIDPAEGRVRVWARSDGGRLQSKDASARRDAWWDHGTPAGVFLRPSGPAAVDWEVPGVAFRLERAFFVASDGTLRTRTLIGGGFAWWGTIASSEMTDLNGPVGAVVWQESGEPMQAVAASRGEDLVVAAGDGLGAWDVEDVGGPSGMDLVGSDVAAGRAGGAPFFCVRTIYGGLGLLRRNDDGWDWTWPGFPWPVLLDAAGVAATRWVRGGEPVAACFARGTDGDLWMSTVDAAGTTEWTSLEAPAGGIGSTLGTVGAATYGGGRGGAPGLDVVVLQPDGALARKRYDAEAGDWLGWEELTKPPDASRLTRGFAVVPAGADGARVFSRGEVGAAGYLYEIALEGDWRNHTAHGVTERRVSLPARSEGEAALAERDGRVAVAAMAHGDEPEGFYTQYVRLHWSESDGRNWGWDVPVPFYDSAGPDYFLGAGDPSVAFDSTGTAYVVLHSFDIPTSHSCLLSPATPPYTFSRIYWVTTDNGSDFSLGPAPDFWYMPQDPGTPESEPFLDHPWIAIDSEDNKHLVWLRVDYGEERVSPVLYAIADPSDSLSGPYTLAEQDDGDLTTSSPWLVLGADDTPFVGWKGSDGVWVCRVEDAACAVLTNPTADLGPLPGDVPFERLSSDRFLPDCPTGACEIRVGPNWAFVASPSEGGRVYLARAVIEGPCYPKACTTLDIVLVESGDGAETWSEPVAVNDEFGTAATDQFGPTVTATDDGTVMVTWYDRRASVGGYENRYYRRFLGVRLPGETEFANYPLGDEPNDPQLLPKKCGDGLQEVFLGDYREAGSRHDHAHVIWTDTHDVDVEPAGRLEHSVLSPWSY